MSSDEIFPVSRSYSTFAEMSDVEREWANCGVACDHMSVNVDKLNGVQWTLYGHATAKQWSSWCVIEAKRESEKAKREAAKK